MITTTTLHTMPKDTTQNGIPFRVASQSGLSTCVGHPLVFLLFYGTALVTYPTRLLARARAFHTFINIKHKNGFFELYRHVVVHLVQISEYF
jgi:hypothetical protein